MLETTSASEGLWMATAPPSPYPALTADVDVDVAVIGGGIAGMTTALLLKRAGARVAVLEAAGIGTGVTGCTTAKVSALQATILSTIRSRQGAEAAHVYAQASAAGVERIETLTLEERIDCELARRPAFTYALEESERSQVDQEHEVAAATGLPVELVDSPDVPFTVFGAVRLADQVQIHPVRYVQGLAEAIDGDGSRVFERTRALSVGEGAPCRITTTGGDVRAGQVVVATHYPILDRGLYFSRLKAQRSYCVAVRLSRGEPSQGMAISSGANSRSIRSYHDLLIVGGEGHSAGSGQANPKRYERLEAFAREHWDVAQTVHRWSAHDLMPYDHLPMIGSYHPRSSRLWVATGFMKWGLATGVFAAMLLADRIAGRENPWSSTFSPHRVSLTSMHEIGQLGAKFSGDFVLDRLRPPQGLSAGSIPRGEARVLPHGIGKKGVFRDDDGTLHAVSLRCTHLGCLLRFNAAERSWDCPCHGSRFGVDGRVLEGPAVHPLAPREP